MKKLVYLFMMVISFFLLSACTHTTTSTTSEAMDVFKLLMEAEDLSGMVDQTKVVITQPGNLQLPTSYQGVQITYQSRTPEIISHEGIVTLPTECWMESRDQQGQEVFPNLNDNWPVVVDVTLSFQGQTRTAKLLFVVAPQVGFTCNKYRG